MNNRESINLTIRKNQLSLEIIHILRQKIVTLLESKIDELPDLQNHVFAKAIHDIALLARRHATFSFMEANRLLEGIPADSLIEKTKNLVVDCTPHPTPELTQKICYFLDNSPYSLLIQKEQMDSFRKTFRDTNTPVLTKEMQIKIAIAMNLPTEELRQLLETARVTQKSTKNVTPSSATPLTKYTVLHAHQSVLGDIIEVDKKLTTHESAALGQIKKLWDMDNEKKPKKLEKKN